MRLEPVSAEHQQIFQSWYQIDRLEAHTCRPVMSGKRILQNHQVTTWVFLIEELAEPVGKFAFFDLNPRNRSAEFGYTINPEFRKQGMGTKMLNLAIDRLFLAEDSNPENIDLHKLYCQTGAFNLASVRLLEKLGFHRDGILREHHELDGKLWDDYIYSLLRREWQSLRSQL
ncbi:MAG TPA: GNAT family protein [Coleofasciculaceae cyanobacterium]